jgi:hypothetical protein
MSGVIDNPVDFSGSSTFIGVCMNLSTRALRVVFLLALIVLALDLLVWRP